MQSQFSSQPALNSTRLDGTQLNSTQVILVRHGRSTFNQLQRYQGSSDDSVLTEAGYETARRVGLYLKHQSIDAIYTSPLKRVQQTVDAMLEQLDSRFPKRLEVRPDLREIDIAAWEGRTFQEVQQSEPEAYRCWMERPQEFCLALPASSVQGAVAVAVQTEFYPVLDLYERAQQFWREVLPRHRGQTIVVASHGGTNRALISTALGLPPLGFHRLQQSNCGISTLSFPEGCFKAGHLKTLNLTTPVGELLPKLKEGKQGLRLLLLPAESPLSANTHLVDLLREVSIDFSLTSTSAPAQTLTDLVLQHHPQTVQLQSQQPQFLLNWQRRLAAEFNSAAPLLTGLVVAPASDIQHILAETVGLNPAQRWKLQVQPGYLSILHYPRANHSVIQALNFA